MKKLFSAFLLIVMLAQILPFDALATVGKVLSQDEMNRAYSLTGIGTGGLKANGDGLYHAGMTPNASWNASQLRDWLDEKLDVDMNTLNDLFSQTSFTLDELKNSAPDTFSKYAGDTAMETAQEMYLEAEELRETLRWYRDQLTEASKVITEMSRLLQEDSRLMFDSDKVRYSARIEAAEQEITRLRQEIADNAADWEARITRLRNRVKDRYSISGTEQAIGGWMSALLSESGAPTSNTASVSRVAASTSRANRLSMAAGLAANDVADAKIKVMSENEVSIVLQSGTKERPVPVAGAKVRLKDVLNPNASELDLTTDETGSVTVSVNQFTMDEFGVIHLRVEADPTAQGYQDCLILDMDLEKGEVYTCNLVPIDVSAGGGDSNDAGAPYVYMMTLGDKDIWFSEYEMIYSEKNDFEIEIRVHIKNTQGKELPGLLMRYYEVGSTTSELKECWASPTGKDGDVYIFKGPWKKLFSPWAIGNKRPTFMFGKDAPPELTFTSRLNVKRSATEEPLNEGTGPDGGVFANVLGQGLGFSFKIPVININVSIKVPFQEYLPRFSVDPAGYVTIFLGDAVFEDSVKKSKLNWKSADTRRFQQAQKWVEQKGLLANTKAQYNLAKDYYKTKKWKLMGESAIDMGIFAVLSGRWELDNDNPDVTTTRVSLRGGAGFTISYSYSWTISYPVIGIPLYVCFTLGISAGFSAELVISLAMNNDQFGYFHLNPLNDITIDIGFMASVQLGIGIKGFVEAWAKLTFSLDIIIFWSIMDATPSGLTITGAITFTVGATIFFITASKTWNLVSGQIWPNDKANLLQHYMNADEGNSRQIDVVSDEPRHYPALMTKLKQLHGSDQRNMGARYKEVRVGEKDFTFGIMNQYDSKNDRYVKRVSWWCVNPDTGTPSRWQSTQELIDHMVDVNSEWSRDLLDRQDYAFDVYADGKYVFLAVTCARDFDEKGYPIRNDLTTDVDSGQRMNFVLYVTVLEHDGNRSLNYKLPAEMCDAGYDFMVRCADHAVGKNLRENSYDSFTNPRISKARVVWKDEAKTDFESYEAFGECPRLAYEEDTAAIGATGFALDDGSFYLFTDKKVKCSLEGDYERFQVLTLMDMDASKYGHEDYEYFRDKDFSMSFVGLSRAKDGEQGDSVIELFGFNMSYYAKKRTSIPLMRGDIDSISIAQDNLNINDENAERTVFYTMQETSPEGAKQNRLHGLRIKQVSSHDIRNPEYYVTRYTYDVDIPTNKFDICYIGGVPYLYWISDVEKQKKEDPDLWRVWVMCYDGATNTLSDPFVLAEFGSTEFQYIAWNYPYETVYDVEGIPSEAILTSGGTAYITVVADRLDRIPRDLQPDLPPRGVMQFSEKMSASASITTAIPQQLAIKAGDFEDMTLGLRNEGNLAISTFDIAMYEVTDGGEGEKLVESAHFNAIEPEKSRLTLADGTVVISGKQVAFREEDYDMTPRKRDWIVDDLTIDYTTHTDGNVWYYYTEVVDPSDPRHVHTEILMPGSTGAYSMAFKIPEDWHGTKTLRMKLTALSVESNLARAVGEAAGIKANGGEASTTLNYVLNPKTGKLELQMPLQANGALKNALDSGLYATEIDLATTDLRVDVHDLEIKHRIYRGLDDERMLDIVVHNHAATRQPLTLSCAVYVDGASDAYILNLPYYQRAVSSRQTHTITLPVNALVDDPAKHKRARVEITAVGTDERAWANNEFTVYFDGEDVLRFEKQPEDVTVQEGEDVAFEVEVAGGVKPYAYQWQVWDEKHGKWIDLPGFTDPVLRREDIEKKWDGCRFRCVVTDTAGTQIISQEVTLTVRDKVPTGDGSNLPLYLAVALAALALLWWLRRRGRAM